MQKAPSNILVVITKENGTQPALERCLRFADNGPLNITLFSSVYESSLELTAVLAPDERKALREQYVKQRTEYLNKLAAEYDSDSVKVKVKVIWSKKPAQAIVDLVADNNFELVVKRISASADSKNPFVMPFDWHLLRYCPCPLLLVRDLKWQEGGSILAAVSPTAEDQEHQDLNHKIISFTQQIAETVGAEIHIINTHVSPALDIPTDYPNFDYRDLRGRVSNYHNEKTQELLKSHPCSERHTHIVEGLPEEKIPATASKIGAQLVVMGTVGRTGLTAALMGNTAERVLSQLNCEVLALKPDNFEV